jgi:polysaccharide biosynthesis transport protein
VNSERQEISVSIQDLVGFFVRGALLALLLGGVAGTLAYVVTGREPPVFRAEATLLVARTTGGFTQFGLSPVTAPPIDLGAYRVAAASDQVVADALRALGTAQPTMGDLRGLRARTGIIVETGARDSSLLRVEGRAETATLAVARANAVAAALVEWDRRRAAESMNRVIATLEQQIEALSEQVRSLQTIGDAAGLAQVDGLVRLRAEQQQQLAYARALVASAEGLVSIIQPADSSPRQVAPRPLLSAGIATLFGIVLAYALVLLRMALNTRLRGSDDIAAVTGLSVLAEFPTVGRQEGDRLREASNYLRANLLFASEEAHPRTFMVTSAVANEGKTTVARNLAEGFVRNGYRTLLVDADLRAPTVIDHYDVVGDMPEAVTTESWLRDAAAGHHILSVALDGNAVLDVIPQVSHVPDAAELLGRGFRSALARWQEYDVIVIDSPPVLVVADPLAIAPHCTGTVLVVDRQRSDRRKLLAAVALLQRVGVQVVGFVANNVEPAAAAAGYGAGYGAAYNRAPGVAPGDQNTKRSKAARRSAALSRARHSGRSG